MSKVEVAEYVEQIAQAFQVLDENGDGTITQPEMVAVFKKLDPTLDESLLATALKSIDANGDGQVDYPEFCTWVMDGDEVSTRIMKKLGKSRSRVRCRFGGDCFRKNREHRQKFSHPGDSDYDAAPPTKDIRRRAPPVAEGLPPTIKQCPACGTYIEKIDGDDSMLCGCEAKAAGGSIEKALENGGCGHEFNWSTLAPISNGKPGEPANDRQILFAPGGALPETPSAARSPKPGRSSRASGRSSRRASECSYPSYWSNASSRKDFLEFRAIDGKDLTKFDELLAATYSAKVTQDRRCPRGICAKTPGGCACVQVYTADLIPDMPEDVQGLPIAYRARRVIRIENSRDWTEYVGKRDEIRKKREGERFKEFDPPVMTADVIDRYPEIFAPLDKDFNETYLMHGTNVKAAISIARSDFRIDLAGSTAGTMYGRGVYMAESCTKADEYASDETGTALDGVFALLLCRTIMGKLYYTTKRREDAEDKVEHGSHDSTVGDRSKSAGTFREFVAYDKEQIYAEYLVLYHRVHIKDDPGKVAERLMGELELDVPVF